jgi:hypothetical protein
MTGKERGEINGRVASAKIGIVSTGLPALRIYRAASPGLVMIPRGIEATRAKALAPWHASLRFRGVSAARNSIG